MKRGNRYLRVLFVQAAWVVLIRSKNWERYGLKPWIEAAKRRLHRNVLAIALANRLAHRMGRSRPWPHLRGGQGCCVFFTHADVTGFYPPRSARE